MKKNTANLIMLSTIFGVSLVAANVMAAKLFTLGFSLFGSVVVLTVGAVVYPVTFLVTDIIGEVWGREHANMVVKTGLVVQILATAFLLIGQFLPAIDPEMQSAYMTVLGQNWIFVIASLTGYLVSQNWDVYIFHKIRNAWIKKHESTAHRWIWNLAATLSAQFIDTALFATIAFGIGFGWITGGQIGMLLVMIGAQFVVKVVLSFISTPVFYIFTSLKEVK